MPNSNFNNSQKGLTIYNLSYTLNVPIYLFDQRDYFCLAKKTSGAFQFLTFVFIKYYNEFQFYAFLFVRVSIRPI